MSYATPQFSRAQYDEAGTALFELGLNDPARNDAVEKISNWRASHALPMNAVAYVLQQKMFGCNCLPNSVTSQRVKRQESIEEKLRQQSRMRLTQMQDIGGCRANLATISDVRRVSAAMVGERTDHEGNKLSIKLRDNYIVDPKPSGYRAIHLIATYQGPKPEYQGLKTEIQIRTRQQHSWATALEICQFFTQKRFKTEDRNANPAWLRFFALASAYIAIIEGTESVPDVPNTIPEIVNEIREIDGQEKILDTIAIWGAAVHSQHRARWAQYYVLHLSVKERVLNINAFVKEQLPEAEKMCQELENKTDRDPAHQVVLASSESLDSLKAAYPNYFVDAGGFTTMLRMALRPVPPA